MEELYYVFTPHQLTRYGKLRKNARFHVARYSFAHRSYSLLCGRDMPDGYYTARVHSVSWVYMPLCRRCREIAERDCPDLGKPEP